MKKIILPLVFIVSSLYSQGGWEIIYYGENPYGIYYKDITFPNNETGWLLCQNRLLKTTDGGTSWRRFSFDHPYSYLSCFYFSNENLGWVIENNNLYVTSTGGVSWVLLDSTITDTRAINMRGIINGWRCGTAGMIKKTTNGGYNWINLVSGTTNNLNSVAFANDDIGACCGDWGTILSTTNGGANWQSFYDPYLGFFDKVSFLNSQTGFVSGTGNNVYVTTNRGVNWIAHYINSSQLTCIRFYANDAYAFGRYTDIFKSTDLGNQWNQFLNTGINYNINTAAISPNSTMWIASDSGFVYKSSNQGNSWSEIYRDYLTKENLNSVYFLDNNTGYICGSLGHLYKSVNGGLNWTLVIANSGYNYSEIQFTDGNTGYLCGGNGSAVGIIFKTINSGLNWQVSYNDSAHFTSMHFINNLTGWATGAAGIILKTTNGGINWIKFSRLFTSTNRDIKFLNENTGFIVKSSIYRSTNGGQNWISVLNYSSGKLFVTDNTVFALGGGTNQIIYKSTTFGGSWENFLTGGSNGGGTIFFKNAVTGWASMNAEIRKTTNGGVNWVRQTSNGINCQSIFFTDPEHGWGTGSYGGIMRTTNGGIGVNQISSEIPKKFMLYQNYPNPFNPVTNIRFEIPYNRMNYAVTIKIYDILGKEVITLVNEKLTPGTYQVEWNASELSSGVYFYSLKTNEFVQTRKMVVLK